MWRLVLKVHVPFKPIIFCFKQYLCDYVLNSTLCVWSWFLVFPNCYLLHLGVLCKSGWFGKYCDQRCSNHCNVSYECYQGNGTCIGGCADGWTSDRCDQGKTSNHYASSWLYWIDLRYVLWKNSSKLLKILRMKHYSNNVMLQYFADSIIFEAACFVS